MILTIKRGEDGTMKKQVLYITEVKLVEIQLKVL